MTTPIIVTTPTYYSVFIGVSERQEELGNTRALKEKRKLEEELHGYRDWIKTARMFTTPTSYIVAPTSYITTPIIYSHIHFVLIIIVEEETGVTNTSGSGQTPAVNVTSKSNGVINSILILSVI